MRVPTSPGLPSLFCLSLPWTAPVQSSGRQKSQVADAIKAAADKSLPFALSNANLISDADARGRAAQAASEPGSVTCHPRF